MYIGFNSKWQYFFGKLFNYDIADFTSSVQDSVFLINSKKKITAGWYMVEIQCVLPISRVMAKVKYNQECADIMLYSHKISKRIIYIKNKSFINISVDADLKKIQKIRMVRVGKKFAYNRMKLKLSGSNLYPTTSLKSNNDSINEIYNVYNLFFSYVVDDKIYNDWLRLYENNVSFEELSKNYDLDFTIMPLISIIMPVFNPNLKWLSEAILSIKSQTYANWELCIADDASTDKNVFDFLNKIGQTDDRIKIVYREKNGHISEASNTALLTAKGEWIGLMDQDDLLAPDALYSVVDVINKNPSCELIYSDEDKIDESNNRCSPYFKPDWNRDLFYSQNMFSHFGVYKHELIKKTEGFRKEFDGSQDYDLVLQCLEHIDDDKICHIPKILYHWRMHIGSTSTSADTKPYANLSGERALNRHITKIFPDATVKSIAEGSYKVSYSLPRKQPLVSLIVLTKNKYNFLKKCISSILEKTSYLNFEIIIVDNGSTEKNALNYLKELESISNITVIKRPGKFNFSALNNEAVELSKGVIIGLINNDVEVVSSNWLEEMVSHALRPQVGAVGARLWYPDFTLQHGGIILGLGGDIAGHAHKFLPRHHSGYCGRASVIQSMSAVTGACLIVRKELYKSIGGLDAVNLPIGCNDVDFCLRLIKAGYKNIWTPFAELIHYESLTRGLELNDEQKKQMQMENDHMRKVWGHLLYSDPAYNPNLSLLDKSGYSLAFPPR